MATIKTSGIVIRKVNVGEADRILTVLTRDRGKIRVVAKGVRRPKAKLAGFTDMFHYNDFVLAEGRNLDIVTSAVTVERFIKDGMDLERIGLMYYLCELVNRLIEETAEVPGSFELLRETFNYIKNHEVHPTIIKSYFEMKMLSFLGFAPQLHKCVGSGVELNGNDDLSFSVRLGGVLQGDARTKDDFARPISPNTLKFLRVLQQVPLEEVLKIKASQEIVEQTSSITSDFVEYVMEGRAKSLAVMGEL